MINLSSGVNSFSVAWTPLNEVDIAGYVVAWVYEDDLVNGDFAPEDHVKNIGPETSTYFNVATAGQYFVKIAAYDSFESAQDLDYANLRWSATKNVTVLPSDLLGISITGEQIFKFNSGASAPTSTSIELSATLIGALSEYVWEYYNGSGWVGLSGDNTASTYTLSYDNVAWTTSTLLVRCSSGPYSDETTIVKLYDGASAINVVITNASQIVNTNSAGVVSSYNNTGTEIRVFEGATELVCDGVGTSPGKWKLLAPVGEYVTPSTNISVVDGHVVVGNANSITNVTSAITYTIEGTSLGGASVSQTVKQTFTLVSSGANGSRTAILEMYKAATTEPTTNFPSGDSVYTWSTGTFTLPSTANGWALTPPALSEGETLWITRQLYTDLSTTPTSTITWASSLARAASSNGLDGTPGSRYAYLEVYKWASVAPTVFPTGTSDYTWSTGTFTTPTISLNGWSLEPTGAAPGLTLYACSVYYIDTDSSAVSTVSWATVSPAYVIGMAGGDAVAYKITVTSPVISKNAPDRLTVGVHSSVTVSSTKTVAGSTTAYGYLTITGNGATEATTATAGPTILSPADASQYTSYTVKMYSQATIGPSFLLDTQTIPVVYRGANAITVVLTNDSHGLPVTSAGVVTYTGSGTSILVYRGDVALNSVSTTPGVGEFSVSAAVASGTVSIGAIDVTTGTSAIVAQHSNLTTDVATIDYTINAENLITTIKKTQTLTKQKEGATGATGLDAKYVVINGEQSFKYLAGSATPTKNSIVLSAFLYGALTTYLWEYHDGINWVALTAPNTNSTYSLPHTGTMWGANQSVRVRCYSAGYYDELTVVKLVDGSDAYTVTISNESHTLYTTNTGVVTYTGSGTAIRVFKGATELNSVSATPATGEFRVVATVTSGTITIGAIDITTGNAATVANHSVMTTDSAVINYAINIENTITINKVQSLSKSKDGANGSNANYVTVTSEQAFKYLAGMSVPVSTNITLTAELYGTLTTYDWEYYNGTSWVNLSGTQNTKTYDLAYNNAAWGAATALRIRCLSGTAYDETTIAKLYDGTNGNNGVSAITVVLTNPVHVFPADSSGTVSTYVGSATDIRVYEGVAELSHDGTGTAPSTWAVPSVSTYNITQGALTDMGVYLNAGDGWGMGQSIHTAYIDYVVTGTRASGTTFTATARQKFAKTLAGPGLTRGDTPPWPADNLTLWFNTYPTDRTYNGNFYYANTQYQLVGGTWVPTTPRGTLIGPDGIYTGLLTATQVNAITLAASQILSGALRIQDPSITGVPNSVAPRGTIVGNTLGDPYINTDGTATGWSKLWHEKADSQLQNLITACNVVAVTYESATVISSNTVAFFHHDRLIEAGGTWAGGEALCNIRTSNAGAALDLGYTAISGWGAARASTREQVLCGASNTKYTANSTTGTAILGGIAGRVAYETHAGAFGAPFSFTKLGAITGLTTDVVGVATNGNDWVLVSDAGLVYYSTAPTAAANWSYSANLAWSIYDNLAGVAFGEGPTRHLVVAVSIDGGSYYSTNWGISWGWSGNISLNGGSCTSLFFGGDAWYVTSTSGRLYRATAPEGPFTQVYDFGYSIYAGVVVNGAVLVYGIQSGVNKVGVSYDSGTTFKTRIIPVTTIGRYMTSGTGTRKGTYGYRINVNPNLYSNQTVHYQGDNSYRYVTTGSLL